ncbi:MAG: hypothetical protein Q4D61_00825 [Cardiobacteriaceae bacterium]|nr:hypothetical protein [Cardiobacteriaceae bacterium]
MAIIEMVYFLIRKRLSCNCSHDKRFMMVKNHYFYRFYVSNKIRAPFFAAHGASYSGPPEKWQRQPFEQSPLFKGLRKKSCAIFWGSGYSLPHAAQRQSVLHCALKIPWNNKSIFRFMKDLPVSAFTFPRAPFHVLKRYFFSFKTGFIAFFYQDRRFIMVKNNYFHGKHDKKGVAV